MTRRRCTLWNIAGGLYLGGVFGAWYLLAGPVGVLELVGALAVVGTVVIGFCRNVTRDSHAAVFEQMHAERRELERRRMRALEAPRLEQAGNLR